MHRAARRLLTLLLGTALVAAPLALVVPAQAAAEPTPPANTVIGWGFDGVGGTVPASLSGRRITAISAGSYHSLALTDDGTVTAWGNNFNGQASVPASLGGKRVTAVAGGGDHSLALTDDGTVTGWGWNAYRVSTAPSSLDGKRVTAISAGSLHSLALTDDGTVTAWGNNDYGQTSLPSSLTGKRVTAISAGYYHSLALTDDGTVTAWGNDLYGASTVPASLDGKRVTAVSAGGHHSLALTDDGTVTAWGTDDYGQSTVPASLDGKRVTAVSAGGFHSLALTDDGTITAWGNNDLSQSTVPVSLDGKRAISIAAGYQQSLAVVLVPPPTITTGLTDDTAAIQAGESVDLTIGADGTDFQGAIVRRGTNAPGTITGSGDRWTISGLTTPGTYDYVVEAQTDAGLLTTTVTVVVTPAAVASLQVTSPSTAKHGDTVSLTVEGFDRFGNATGDVTDDVTITSSSSSDTVSGTDVTFGSAGPRTLTATHVNGSTATVRVVVSAAPTTTAPPKPVVTLPAARLSVAVTDEPVVRGTRTTVAASRLAPRERYTVSIAGRTVARGVADARGRVRRAVVVPRTRPAARQLVTVTGSQKNRTGRDTLAVVASRLTATAKKSAARASTSQLVTVRGLVPGQTVRVTYRGKRVSTVSAKASRNGTYRVRFDVGQRWGTKKVTVRSGDRTTHVRFAVTPRHG